MAVSRPLLLALMGVLLATATMFAARGARDTAAEPAAAPVNSQAVAPVTPAPDRPDAPPTRPRDETPGARDRTPAGGEKPAGDRNPAGRDGKPARPLQIPEGVPRPVGRALAQKRVVVLFFGQGGADDAATQDAVAAVRDLQGVSVFTDSIKRLAKYRAVTSALGIAQAPAVVVVGKDRQAQLMEGFIDAGTLRQIVVDAR